MLMDTYSTVEHRKEKAGNRGLKDVIDNSLIN